MKSILILISILLTNQKVNGCNSGGGGNEVAFDDGYCFGGLGGCVDTGCRASGLNIYLH